MQDPVVAVVGTGFIGPVHVEALRRLGIRVKGVLGSSSAKSKASALSLKLDVGYKSLSEVLADRDVNVVHLASPNRAHKEQVLAALEAGKHVVCEKPLAMNAAEASELAEAARRHPELICAVNYNVRFYPLSIEARSLVRSGEVGDIFNLHASYTQDWLLYPTDFNWRVLAEEGGKLRAVGDIGTHLIDLILFICGVEIEYVMADLRTVHPVRFKPDAGSSTTFGKKAKVEAAPVHVETEDCGSVLLRFKGGAKGVITVSQVNAGRKNCIRYEIAGSKCALAWNSESPDELWIGRRGAPNSLCLRDPALLNSAAAAFSGYPAGHVEGYPDTFKQLYRAIYADIAAGRRSPEPLDATFDDGLRELVLCEAIAQSNSTGTWVRVPN
jgi:predicted dehydrogenase